MGNGGGGQKDPKFPDAIKDIYKMGKPLAGRLATAGLEGLSPWDVPSPVLPTQQWWESLSPEVMSGLWAPYQQAGSQLMETLGGGGQLGSARGGYSGATGVALGTLAAEAGKNVGLQAWGMTSPQMMEYRNQLLQSRQAPFTLFPAYLGGMGQLPMYANPNQMSPWMGAMGGAAMGAGAGSAFGPWGAALGGIGGGLYGYYANK